MRLVLAAALALGLAAPALAAPAIPRTQMGAWGCNGTKPTQVTFEPGEQLFQWTGACGGAEGFDVVVDPKPTQGITTRMTYDAKTKVLTLRVTNAGARTTAKLSVFVGFA